MEYVKDNSRDKFDCLTLTSKSKQNCYNLLIYRRKQNTIFQFDIFHVQNCNKTVRSIKIRFMEKSI